MEVKEVETKKIWDTYLQKLPRRSFLQTWEWGEFQFKGLKKRVHFLAIYKENVMIGVALSIEESNRLGRFLYSPRGPLCKRHDLRDCLKGMSDFAKQNGYIFYRADPEYLKFDNKVSQAFSQLGYRSAANFVQVQRCWIMNLARIETEDDMYQYAKEKGMSKSIPRHIRKSAKNGVTTRISVEQEDVEILLDMLHGLVQRKGIPQRDDNYYREMFKHMAPAGHMKLIIAEHDGTPISAILLATHNGEVATLHGASKDGIPQSLYVAKKIYWDAIMYAVNNGYKRFNFWGVLSEQQMEDSTHPSFGYSLFKRRMGGEELSLIDTQDLPIRKVRWLMTYLIERYRKIKYKVD